VRQSLPATRWADLAARTEDETFVRTAELPSFTRHDMSIIGGGHIKLYWMPKNVVNEAA
jgi:hypothetical protein